MQGDGNIQYSGHHCTLKGTKGGQAMYGLGRGGLTPTATASKMASGNINLRKSVQLKEC